MNSNEKETNKTSDIPESSSSKPMDSKQDVAQSPDEKTDQDFPGYPHYPAKEDIMHQSTGSHRVDANLEEMATGANASGVNQRYQSGQENDRTQTGTDDTTNADSDRSATNDEIGLPHNVSNEDLDRASDVPGTDIKEAAEKGSTNP